ncbi:TPA: autotransporter outer membrane beta-barrel domain-containing protein, partial [Escherichia albertii]|nr:autotransporter outer membrane beta-barrel domain-containing protein [Escherichia albertii]
SRLFKFKTLNLINSDFIVGRNAIVVGDIVANNSTLSLNGKDTKVHIDMYDGKNITGDGFGFRQDIKDGVSVSPESSSYFGYITLNNKSSLDIGNKFTGGIEAYDSSVSVTSQNAVFDRVGSFVNSTLSLEKGAKLTAQSGIFSTGAVDVKENASLTLTGIPSVEKQGYYSPVVSIIEGIHLGEQASLSVKNMSHLTSDINAENAAAINLGDGEDTVGKT